METVPDIQLATALASALLHSLWQCALLAAGAAATLQMLNGRSAALRHTVGMGFLLAMSVVPAWTFVADWLQPDLAVTNALSSAAPDVFLRSLSGWAGILCGLWLFGVALMLARQLGGLWWLGQLEHRDFQPLPVQWQERLDALRRTMGITRRIVVRVAKDAVVPFTARLLKPIIWMPHALLARLPHEQIEALLAHELAHIHRLDWLWNGIQCVIEALLFFHPGVWWLSQRLREEREHACDDAAVEACADSIALAEALATLARDRQSFPRLLLAADGGPLVHRITRLLSIGAPPTARPWPVLWLIALVVMGAVVVAPLSTGYATPSPRVEVSEKVERAAEQRTLNAEEIMRAAEQRTRDAEEVVRIAEQRTRDREQVARDAEQASRE